jgi:hypothetical protein
MTTKELIEKLKQYPPDTEVFAYEDEFYAAETILERLDVDGVLYGICVV